MNPPGSSSPGGAQSSGAWTGGAQVLQLPFNSSPLMLDSTALPPPAFPSSWAQCPATMRPSLVCPPGARLYSHGCGPGLGPAFPGSAVLLGTLADDTKGSHCKLQTTEL